MLWRRSECRRSWLGCRLLRTLDAARGRLLLRLVITKENSPRNGQSEGSVRDELSCITRRLRPLRHYNNTCNTVRQKTKDKKKTTSLARGTEQNETGGQRKQMGRNRANAEKENTRQTKGETLAQQPDLHAMNRTKYDTTPLPPPPPLLTPQKLPRRSCVAESSRSNKTKTMSAPGISDRPLWNGNKLCSHCTYLRWSRNSSLSQYISGDVNTKSATSHGRTDFLPV